MTSNIKALVEAAAVKFDGSDLIPKVMRYSASPTTVNSENSHRSRQRTMHRGRTDLYLMVLEQIYNRTTPQTCIGYQVRAYNYHPEYLKLSYGLLYEPVSSPFYYPPQHYGMWYLIHNKAAHQLGPGVLYGDYVYLENGAIQPLASII
jgi:hypothetical protein